MNPKILRVSCALLFQHFLYAPVPYKVSLWKQFWEQVKQIFNYDSYISILHHKSTRRFIYAFVNSTRFLAFCLRMYSYLFFREQRVTGFFIHLLIGLSTLITSVLRVSFLLLFIVLSVSFCVSSNRFLLYQLLHSFDFFYLNTIQFDRFRNETADNCHRYFYLLIIMCGWVTKDRVPSQIATCRTV